MASKWIEYDAILLPLIEQYGTRWKIIAQHLPKKITVHAARNRWMRLNPKQKLKNKCKNKCKLCGQMKRGHNWVTCKRLSQRKADFQEQSSPMRDEEHPTSDDTELSSVVHTETEATLPLSSEERTETATSPSSAEEHKEHVLESNPTSRPVTPFSDYPMSDSENLSYSTLFDDIDYDSLKFADTGNFDETFIDIELNTPHNDEEDRDEKQLKELQEMISNTSIQLNAIRKQQMVMSAQIQEIKSMIFQPADMSSRVASTEKHSVRRMHLTTSIRRHFIHQFNIDRHPSAEVREELAQISGKTIRQIDNWFCNRRKRNK